MLFGVHSAILLAIRVSLQIAGRDLFHSADFLAKQLESRQFQGGIPDNAHLEVLRELDGDRGGSLLRISCLVCNGWIRVFQVSPGTRHWFFVRIFDGDDDYSRLSESDPVLSGDGSA